ncbi:MAG TPA: phosphoribosylformylglycinamidine cyclo-ligase [Candidatus Melainabacteria bacterium]|jgi:phosphoribosylformylglycinamidine cyclo-ligase|nr:phosphoribosylformylglycinamidine cyclo-ligase [Candidatus Melainabacteria bacterium]HIN63400.1 phosphoribosylformylglycinamidine cyclo-ligase [Candidatus Obscuribacterales bacterium]
MEPKTYAQAGVDVLKAEAFVTRLKSLSKRADHQRLWPAAGGYAAVYPVDERTAMALTTDGVGTKLLIALELKQLSTIGIDLVAMCANDLVCVGARPVAFLDYYAVGKLVDEDADQIMQGIVEGCDQAGLLLVGGETAEMPDLYKGGHFDMAGFAVGLVSKEKLITGDKIKKGQKVVGVASSGIHSNGLSLASKLVGNDKNLKEKLLEPTLIYTKPVNEILDKKPEAITGVTHITGGGWRNMLRLSKDVGYKLTELLQVPEIFEYLGRNIEPDEMYKTFNMGMGMTLTTDGDADLIIKTFSEYGFTAKVVGEVTDSRGELVIDGVGARGGAINLKE